jgi:hypothetical protein
VNLPPSSVRTILPICKGHGYSPIRGHTIRLLVIANVPLPTCDLVLPPGAFCIQSAECSMKASMMQSVICHSHVGNIGPSRRKSAQIKAYSVHHRLHVARELTEILPRHVIHPRCSQLRHHEAFLRLARSQRMKAMPRQSLYCRNHRGALP